MHHHPRQRNDLNEGLFSTIHEMGHALYEQGINREFEATPLAGGTSSGVHESQSSGKTSWDVAATFEVLLSSAASRVP